MGSADKLSTTSVAESAGIAVSSLYRYFDDSWDIIDALIDRQVDRLNAQMVGDLAGAESVSLQTLLEFFFRRQFEYFQNDPGAVLIWFETRQREVVLKRVYGHYKAMGRWFLIAAETAGFVENHPHWAGEGLIWVGDRIFELIFRLDRPDAERVAILEEAMLTIGRQMNKDFATTRGLEGIPGSEFMTLMAEYAAGENR